jgi:putative nucleotidyltransferase with HDIG domain
MNREQGFDLLNKNITNQNLIKHSLAVEAIMRALAQHFGEDKEKWGLAGLLHDIDYEKTKDNPTQHSLVGARLLENLGIDKDICQAVKVHNEAHGILPKTLLEKALFVVDPLTGLIVASALVLPSKTELPFMEAKVKKRTKSSSPKLADLTPENVLNRFKEKAFARGANREIIKKSEEYLNLSLEEFVKIGLQAMQKISSQLGL